MQINTFHFRRANESADSWVAAEKLVKDVDQKDISYIAFSKHFKSKLWSGDKALIKGVSGKGFTNFISTNELFELRQAKMKR